MSIMVIFGLWLLKWAFIFVAGTLLMALIVPVIADYLWRINLIPRRRT